jgi:acetyltransferase
VPPANLDAVVAALQSISELLALEPRIAEIDINPLLADAQGVIALDARVRVSAQAPGGAARFAIPPYPEALSETWPWNGDTLTVRPIRPEDEDQHRAFLSRLDPADIRMRIFYSRRQMEHSELARLTQIDYGREMAFIATRTGEGRVEETLGVVRAICDPDNQDAEFGIVVRSDLKGGGLGARLMNKLIAYLRAKGTRRLVANVLQENERMLQLAHELGFKLEAQPADAGVRWISLDLQPRAD